MTKCKLALVIFIASTALPLLATARAEAPSVNVQQQERERFVYEFAQTVVIILQDPKKKYNDRKDLLRNAFSASVDIDWIARFVLGNTWKRASDEEKARYVSLYRRYLTETYVSNFAENPDKRIRDIKVLGISDTVSDDNSFNVRTQMVLVDWEKLQVSYLVNENEGRYKVRDIAIENVSLINSHRTEIGALAAAKGVEAVIAKLEKALYSDGATITLSMR